MRTGFRETLWFKKGQLDAEAAQTQAAAEGSAVGVDTLPVEDRYLDDGSLQPTDSEAFGLHTGTTQAIGLISLAPLAAEAGVPEGKLIAEMKGGRMLVVAMIAVVAAVLGGAAMLIV